MALPTIETPTFEIELPHTKKKQKFRPFLVKEEKILILANESSDETDMIRATQQIVTNCSFGEVDGESLPVFALQKIFLDIRAKSVSETIDLGLKCGSCGHPHTYKLEIEKIKITENPEHSSRVKISDDIFVEMNYPTPFEMQELFNSETTEQLYEVVSKCLHIIYQGDEIYNAYESSDKEKQSWVESLTLEQFFELRKFFETMPVLVHEMEFICKECKKRNYINLNGYQNFFV